MKTVLDMTHYYVEIDSKTSISSTGRKMTNSYTLLDVTNIQDIIAPINLDKEHKCIIKINVSDRENYERMCKLVAQDKLSARILKFKDIDIRLVYNNSFVYYLKRLDNFLFLISIGDEHSSEVFNINIEDNETNNLREINNKLNMLGQPNQNVTTFGNHMLVEIQNSKGDVNYINKLIKLSDFVRLCYTCTLRNKHINLYNSNIYEIYINALFQKYNDIKLPFNKLLMLDGNGELYSDNNIEFNCDTWIIGYDTFKLRLSALDYINSQYIRYLRSVVLITRKNTCKALDLRGLDDNIILYDVIIIDFHTILLNACSSNISSSNSIVFDSTEILISNNKDISNFILSQDIKEIVYMNSDIQSDLRDFENLNLNSKFSRVATAEERKLYQRNGV